MHAQRSRTLSITWHFAVGTQNAHASPKIHGRCRNRITNAARTPTHDRLHRLHHGSDNTRMQRPHVARGNLCRGSAPGPAATTDLHSSSSRPRPLGPHKQLHGRLLHRTSRPLTPCAFLHCIMMPSIAKSLSAASRSIDLGALRIS